MLFNGGTTENHYGGMHNKDNEDLNESEYDYLLKEGEIPLHQISTAWCSLSSTACHPSNFKSSENQQEIQNSFQNSSNLFPQSHLFNQHTAPALPDFGVFPIDHKNPISSNEESFSCMNPACISAQNEIDYLKHVITQQKLAIEWLHTSMFRNQDLRFNPWLVPQKKQLQNQHENNREKVKYAGKADNVGRATSGNPSLYSRFESNRVLKKEQFGWPSMIEIQIYLENLEIRQSNQSQKKGKKKLLPEIKEFLDQALDVQSDLFGSWCDLYQTSVNHKMSTVSKAIIQHLLTWVPLIDSEKVMQLQSVVLLENLKRSLLRIFHKVKRLNVARKTFA